MGDTVTWPSADGAADSVTPVPTPPRSLPAAFSAGAGVGVLGGLIGLGGAEFPAAADRAVPVPRSPSPPGWPRCPIDTLVDYWFVVVNLLAGSLIGAWIGATWATRMRSITLHRVLAVLVVLIAVALAWDRATSRLRWPRPYKRSGTCRFPMVGSARVFPLVNFYR